MTSKLHVTTSWDDGNPSDFRVAEMLAKHGLDGTFYIPHNSEYSTMSPSEIRSLASAFEIGAHTLSHIILTETDSKLCKQEINDSKLWLEDLLGKPCTVFCFPQGKFRNEHVSMVREAGFLGARTVELLATRLPEFHAGLAIMPTTVQAMDHRRESYLRNALKRRSGSGLWNFVRTGAPQDWTQLAQSMFEQASRRPDCTFHLWGHSWELDRYDQWARLEIVFDFLASHQDRIVVVSNGELCRRLDRSLRQDEVTS